MTLLGLCALALLPSPSPFAPTGGLVERPAEARESAEDLLARGRELLRAGRADEALPLLERADEASGRALATRVWRIRCDIARGYLNDALDAVDELARRGERVPAIDYLYGLAFHARAKEYIALGVGGGLVGMNFGDAAQLLARATEADRGEFHDAFLPLAESLWHAGELPRARAAAERALELRPAGFDEAYLLGRIAFSQFVAAKEDPARADEAEQCWQRAYEAFLLASQSAGEPKEPARRTLLAQCEVQTAYALAWKQRRDEASEHFSRAMGWDPTQLDYRSLWTTLEGSEVLRALERGALLFREIHGPQAKEDALLLWWLGWANFDRQLWEEAEKSFARALAKAPQYADCNLYIGLARYHRKDPDAAVRALVEGWSSDSGAMTRAAESRSAECLAIFARLLDRCASAQPPRNAEAAALAEMRCALDPSDPLFWSYVGLFHRDAGDGLARDGSEAARERRAAHYEKALAGYSAALELAPDDPNYLNDTAVVLHYCLGRELERARELYQRAESRARELLARTDLTPEQRELYETALRDSRSNLARLGAR